MIRKAFYIVTGTGLVLVLLFGRDAASYVSTTYHHLTGAVKDSVPVEFQIDRARTMVRDLEPEIRRSMHIIAKEEVALEQLGKQIEALGAEDREGQERDPASAVGPGPEQGRLSLCQPHVLGRSGEART